MRLKRNTAGSKGFTLIELMIVIGIIAIISTVGYPGFKLVKQENALKASAAQLVANFRFVQQLAMNEQLEYRITFKGDGRGYMLGTAAETVKTVRLENGISLDLANSTGLTSNGSDRLMTVDARGGAGAVKKVAFKTPGGKHIYTLIGPGGKAELQWQ